MIYTPLWHKYRPAILKMMVESERTPQQQYQLSKHEFVALNDRMNTKFTFVLKLSNNRPLNKISDSPVAMSLLEILKSSKTAADLSINHVYELSLDRSFVLRVTRLANAETEVLAEEKAAN